MSDQLPDDAITAAEACARVHDKWFHSMPVADEACARVAARAAAAEREACARLAETRRDECVYLDDLGAMTRSAYQDIADLIRARETP